MYNYVPYSLQRNDYEAQISSKKLNDSNTHLGTNQNDYNDETNNVSNLVNRSKLSNLDKQAFWGPSATPHHDTEKFESTFNQNYYITMHLSSKLRNVTLYPNANDYTITIPNPLERVKTVKIKQLTLPLDLYNVNETNNCLYFSEVHDNVSSLLYYMLRVPNGNYSASTLISTINSLFSSATLIYNIYLMSGESLYPVYKPPTNVNVIYYHNQSSHCFLRMTPTTTGSLTYIHCAPNDGYDTLGRLVIESVSAVLNVSMTLYNENTYTVDIITFQTNYISNITLNSLFDCGFTGELGTFIAYSNMTNFVNTVNSSIFTTYDVSQRTVTFYVDSTDPSKQWPFYPRNPEQFKSGYVTSFAQNNNIAPLLGFLRSGPTGTLNKIIAFNKSNISSDTSTADDTFITRWPSGLDHTLFSAASPYPQLIVNGAVYGNYDEHASSLTNLANRMVTFAGITDQFSNSSILDSGYIRCSSVYIGSGVSIVSQYKTIFIRLTLGGQRDVGNIKLVNSAHGDNIYLAKTRYMVGQDCQNAFFENFKALGSECFKVVYPKVRSIQIRLYDENANLLSFREDQHWSCDLLFSGRETITQ